MKHPLGKHNINRVAARLRKGCVHLRTNWMRRTVNKERVEKALDRAGLRSKIDAIEDNPSKPGEVILWINDTSHCVHSIREAKRVAWAARTGTHSL